MLTSPSSTAATKWTTSKHTLFPLSVWAQAVRFISLFLKISSAFVNFSIVVVLNLIITGALHSAFIPLERSEICKASCLFNWGSKSECLRKNSYKRPYSQFHLASVSVFLFWHFCCQAITGCTKHSPEKKFSQPLMFEETTPNRQVRSHFSDRTHGCDHASYALCMNCILCCFFHRMYFNYQLLPNLMLVLQVKKDFSASFAASRSQRQNATSSSLGGSSSHWTSLAKQKRFRINAWFTVFLSICQMAALLSQIKP